MTLPSDADLGQRSGDRDKRLRRLALLQRINFHLFWLAFVGIFGGLLAGCVSVEMMAVMMYGGFALVVLVMIEVYFLYPRLRCPDCGRRFFLPEGWWQWIARVNPSQRTCLHCGLDLRTGERKSP